MASYQTRGRDPLFDSTTQAALERRSRELLGLGLIGAGLAAALMLWSYHPGDPNWMLATDAPVQNWLGRFGASVAHPVTMIVGRAGWIVPLLLMAWGLRLSLHRGEERLGRLIFAPIAVVAAAIHAAMLTPGEAWEAVHRFGLGGLLGDTVVSVLLTVLPVGTGLGVRLLSILAGIGMIAIIAYVAGVNRQEFQTTRRVLLIGTVQLYDLGLRLAGRSAQASAVAAQGLQARVAAGIADRRERVRLSRQAAAEEAQAAAIVPPAARMPVAEAPRLPQRPVAIHRPAMPPMTGEPPMPPAPPTARAMPPRMMPSAAVPAAEPLAAPAMPPLAAPPRAPAPPPATEAAGLGALLSRVPTLLRRAPAPEAEIPEAPEPPVIDDLPPEDQVRARIADAIRARARTAQATAPFAAPRIEPSLGRPRGPRPLILDTAPRVPLPPEPPLTAAAIPAAPPVLPPVGPAIADTPPPAPRVLTRAAAPAPVIEDAAEDDEDVWDNPVEMPAFVTRPAPPLAAEPRTVVQPLNRKPIQPSTRARAEAQPALPLEDQQPAYEFPPLDLLMDPAEVQRHHLSSDALEENARMLENVLDDYGVKGEIVSVRPGPVVTMYELEPAPGLKASRVIGLADDIARSMSALSARVSTVPGRSVIGIELPNANREKVVLREILSARDFGDSQMRLPLALGKDIAGEPIVANLAKMPHLLIAGTTGSGKSVAINTMILSLLYKLTPEECRLIMIDPKMLELSVYDGIPHLLSPVVTDPKKAVVALKWVVGEMEERYRKMSKMGVRNIEGYNGRVRDALARGETFSRTVQTGFDEDTGDPIFETDEIQPELLPYIVVIVDEMADLMMVAGKEIEACIQRLAQMARASGIHLIMATQRPSVDVITGTIKANFPTRISFQVTSKIDSRTILGEQGAEQLLGMGDMLYMAGGGRITRIHGPFCSDEEVEEVVRFLKSYGPPDYKSGVTEGPDEDRESDIDAVLGLGSGTETEDALYDMAVQIVAKDRKCSTSYIQRKLAIGYNKAARLVEQMETNGVVSPANAVGKREILVPEVH